MIRNYVFDIDGTLFDTKQLTIASISHALTKVGLPPLTRDDWDYFYKHGMRALVNRRHISGYKIWFVIYFFRKYKLNHLDHLQLFPGLLSVLKILHNHNKTLGIVSSNSRKIIKQILINTRINYFSFIHSAGFLGKKRALTQILRKYSLHPAETIYIGDEIQDIIAAKEVGIKSAAVTWGFNSRQSLLAHHPDFLLNSPKDILKIT